MHVLQPLITLSTVSSLYDLHGLSHHLAVKLTCLTLPLTVSCLIVVRSRMLHPNLKPFHLSCVDVVSLLHIVGVAIVRNYVEIPFLIGCDVLEFWQMPMSARPHHHFHLVGPSNSLHRCKVRTIGCYSTFCQCLCIN